MRWHGKLKPRYEPKRRRYRLEISATISKSGDRERLFFRTEEAAWEAIGLERKRIEAEGLDGRKRILNTDELVDANNARKVLGAYYKKYLAETGRVVQLPRLEALAKQWVRQATAETHSVTLDALYEMYERSLQGGVSPRTLESHKYTRRKFKSLAGRLVCNLTAEQIADVLTDLRPHAFNAHRRDIMTVLNYGLRKGYLSRNPVMAVDKRRYKKREIVTLPNEQVRVMLEYARANEPRFLIYPILTTLAGIRPDGEISRLRVKDLDLANAELFVRESKTGDKRVVRLEESAVEWLRICEITGQPDEPLVPFTPAALRRVRRRVWQAIDFPRGGGSILRATYFTNLISSGKSYDYVARNGGHTNTDITLQKYAKIVSERDARDFWLIRPQPALRDDNPPRLISS